MAADGKQPIILKKKVVAGGGGHHGGAWKVAYADFVTAMMAFFLLMWLLNATTEDQRKGIADYFDPSIPISRISAGGTGMLNGDSVFAQDVRAQSGTGGYVARMTRGARGESRPIGAPGVATTGERPAEAGLSDMEALEESLQSVIGEAGADGDLSRHMRVRVTAEGLVIELVDTNDKELFRAGSARPSERLDRLLDVVSDVLLIAQNDIAVVGHTDASGFSAGASYGNWELSTDRAHAARRALVATGLPEGRITTVSGAAATQPIAEDPYAPENRRIAITLLKDLRQ